MVVEVLCRPQGELRNTSTPRQIACLVWHALSIQPAGHHVILGYDFYNKPYLQKVFMTWPACTLMPAQSVHSFCQVASPLSGKGVLAHRHGSFCPSLHSNDFASYDSQASQDSLHA